MIFLDKEYHPGPAMLSHHTVWSAIDRLAETRSLSVSALAKAAGLDPTAFNKSKRIGPDGRPRWPSTESLAKIFDAANADMREFFGLAEASDTSASPARAVPLIGLAQAGSGGFFGENGLPQGEAWDAVHFPADAKAEIFAIEVQGESMLPLYRDGDTLIVEPGADVRKGDRVVVKTRDGEVLAKLLARRTLKQIELQSLNPEHANRVFDTADVEWIARIIWASQ
jgi:phage repressor protein C with HTH and peptisase S24 domain